MIWVKTKDGGRKTEETTAARIGLVGRFVHPDGRSGWVPEGYFARGGSVGVAQRDYLAVELTVEEGEEVALGELGNGWYWVTNEAGERGWVPAAHLELIVHQSPLTEPTD
ncbi:MAG TPA: SH3 domain-containing protein [Ardenticatenaceae bacterium]